MALLSLCALVPSCIFRRKLVALLQIHLRFVPRLERFLRHEFGALIDIDSVIHGNHPKSLNRPVMHRAYMPKGTTNIATVKTGANVNLMNQGSHISFQMWRNRVIRRQIPPTISSPQYSHIISSPCRGSDGTCMHQLDG